MSQGSKTPPSGDEISQATRVFQSAVASLVPGSPPSEGISQAPAPGSAERAPGSVSPISNASVVARLFSPGASSGAESDGLGSAPAPAAPPPITVPNINAHKDEILNLFFDPSGNMKLFKIIYDPVFEPGVDEVNDEKYEEEMR